MHTSTVVGPSGQVRLDVAENRIATPRRTKSSGRVSTFVKE